MVITRSISKNSPKLNVANTNLKNPLSERKTGFTEISSKKMGNELSSSKKKRVVNDFEDNNFKELPVSENLQPTVEAGFGGAFVKGNCKAEDEVEGNEDDENESSNKEANEESEDNDNSDDNDNGDGDNDLYNDKIHGDSNEDDKDKDNENKYDLSHENTIEDYNISERFYYGYNEFEAGNNYEKKGDEGKRNKESDYVVKERKKLILSCY
ncbi:pheromone-processing carboxypeptidase KEX1-like [Mercurialis annua]|uniref:pheromone-processing carboxypeptidase KEX1-like n=1 Tax=Mercurialis annua TaxID=3986 RepID=UPI00215E0DDC|nr:pheromone-processing carboxypeptidase KEX1-like [Mercurialis annua]